MDISTKFALNSLNLVSVFCSMQKKHREATTFQAMLDSIPFAVSSAN
ncbi:MAG: hypothetical protein KAJ54_02975 [Candidatus Aenigmarchaeota archaeon]|nr:hypothetical protein [Candidatus Aenigmarchaeota archaeon]MCK5322124.1 hypothetical protein [Candidatus Aenigmarchaeota archaeon]